MAIHEEISVSDFAACEAALDTARSVFDTMLHRARELTGDGKRIDDHQVLTRRVAGLATRFEAARHLLDYAKRADDREGGNAAASALAASVFLSEAINELRSTLDACWSELDLDETLPLVEELSSYLRANAGERHYRKLGEHLLDHNAEYNGWIWSAEGDGSDESDLRDATRRFARTAVAPRAEEIHRQDLLIPQDLLEQVAEMGYFGMSIPKEYGGVGMTNLMMVLATEELSAASLPAAGSLITRPEILAKALLQGGTEAQKNKWLEPVATGKLMVAIAVTEPNVGSDVANIACKATTATVDGQDGYILNGAKAWCTFAGRADILALLARTEDDPALGHRGLSLFIVEKDPFPGHEFEMKQKTGGVITGKAEATLGYRGMHSYTLQFQDYFVPAENLVGEAEGRGKGFYLQMGGFAAGRLQTGGRALGLAQASLEAAVIYAKERPQFGKPIAEFQNTQYEIGAMAVHVEAARQLTYAAARAMDNDEPNADLMAAMAKLFASRVAVNVSQRAQLLHGGWGYAEEYPISRYVVDALVLPIFEGVEPILEMKVIGRGLLRGA